MGRKAKKIVYSCGCDDCFNCPYPDCIVNYVDTLKEAEFSDTDNDNSGNSDKKRFDKNEYNRKYMKKYYQEHKEYYRQYWEKNRERQNEYLKKYREEHREEILAKQRDRSRLNYQKRKLIQQMALENVKKGVIEENVKKQ